ncbi:MAG: O-antigen ligase family protein [bacterium]
MGKAGWERFLYYGLIVLAALTPLLGWKLKYLWMIMAAAWFVKGPSFKNVLLTPVIMYAFVTVLSIVIGVDPAASFHYSIKNDVSILIFFIVASSVKDKKQAMLLIRVFLTGAVVVCVLGLLQYLFQNSSFMEKMLGFLKVEPLRLSGGRIYANRIHPVIFANNIGLYIPVMLAFYMVRRSAFSFVGVVLFFLILFLTYTRMIILSVGVWFFLMSLLFFKKMKYIALPILISVILMTGFLVVSKCDTLKGRLNLNNGGRFFLWANALKLIKKQPLFGAGPGNEMKVFNEYAKSRTEYYHLHNNLIQIAAERGVFAAVVYLWALFVFFRALVNKIIFGGLEKGRVYILVGLMAGFAIFTVCGLTDYTFCRPEMYFPFYFLAGIAMSGAFKETSAFLNGLDYRKEPL